MKAWTGDPRSNLMAPATSRLWRYVNMNTTGNALRLSASFLVTYHGIKWTQTFTDKNYPSGDGSGLEVTLHRDDTDEILLRGTTSPGGTVSFDWFDDTVKVYAQSYHGTQPTAYRGRSAAKLMSA